ncbi:hypothetical protein A8H40_06640 [Burkholderia multivorans]|nr:hypothetical protein A8H40_06640 [Burkholderia multivorans]EJO58974.1 hypothetical protein BURMUCF1_A0776 [Burkholderia multivorans ATCC BAA-247]
MAQTANASIGRSPALFEKRCSLRQANLHHACPTRVARCACIRPRTDARSTTMQENERGRTPPCNLR